MEGTYAGISGSTLADSLKGGAFMGSILVGGVEVAAYRVIPPYGFAHQFGCGVACVPPALLLGSLLFVVRSYTVSGGHLAISRLFWTTTIPILEIHEAYHDPTAIKGSLRIFGNGRPGGLPTGAGQIFPPPDKPAAGLCERNR